MHPNHGYLNNPTNKCTMHPNHGFFSLMKSSFSSVLKFRCDDSLAVVAQGMVELRCRINSARRKCLCTYLKFANTADALNTPVRTRQGTAMTRREGGNGYGSCHCSDPCRRVYGLLPLVCPMTRSCHLGTLRGDFAATPRYFEEGA